MHSYEWEVGPSMTSWVGYTSLETLVNIFSKSFEEESSVTVGDKKKL